MTRRTLAALLVCLVAISALAPAAVAASPTPTTDGPTPLPAVQESNETATNATDAPTAAEQARISPAGPDVEYQRTSVTEDDAVFNTTGEFAYLSSTEPIDAVRISQSKADAEVLEGGHTIRVEYKPDAAPANASSLYPLEVFFDDGSSTELELYASATDQSVAAAQLEEWKPTIETLKDEAEEDGYDRTPAGTEEYVTWVDERAQLVDGFLTELAAQTIAWLIAGLMNPLNVILALALGALAMWRRRSKHGDLVDALSSMAGRYEQELTKLRNDRQRAKRTADDDQLSEVPAIGSYADYYEDAFGVKSPAQLAHLTATGEARATNDGLEMIHHGVADLNPEDLHDTWLEPVLRHLPNERQVLNHLLQNIKYMETEHNLGSVYRETRNDLEVMLDDLERKETQVTSTPAAAGDD
ncbi:hypothetical protein [Natrinema thermotolerans]|uniref:hypothetical protein n=1 Tax=Natrinema thermotolerans TaxID=121872 RepID=UPI000679226B|nr:hypothetical protein [Natrinema thermotolerans]QCC57203.1 hypothetical protein DVR14_00580 [Natrinema thermotolerans]